MAEEQALVAGVKALSVAALPNLPLPRQLRDKIWGYLLYHEHVHAKPYKGRSVAERGKTSEETRRSWSSAHTYKFHPAILAVNHQINIEATKMLKSNEFVLVLLKAPFQGSEKHVWSVPIVTENPGCVARFNHHVLRLHIEGSTGLNKPLREDQKEKTHSFCMIASDLPLFCHVVQHYFHYVHSPVKLVASKHDVEDARIALLEVDVLADKTRFFQTNIQFHTKDLSGEAALKLLQSFDGMVAAGQHVKIQGYDHALERDMGALQDRMGPKTAWVSALAWEVLKTVQKDRNLAHQLIAIGDYEGAGRIYSNTHKLSELPWLFGLPEAFYRSDAVLPLSLLILAIIDGAVVLATIWIHIGRSKADQFGNDQFRKVIMRLPELTLFFTRLPRETKKKVMSNCIPVETSQGQFPMAICRALWCQAINTLPYCQSNVGSFLASMLNSLKTVQPAFKGNRHYEHDLQVLEALADNQEFRMKHLKNGKFGFDILDNFSARVLPLQTFDSPIPEDCQTPEGILGWTDFRQLNKLMLQYPDALLRLYGDRVHTSAYD